MAGRSSTRARLLSALALLLCAFLAYVAAGLPSRDSVRDLARRTPGATELMRQREAEAKEKRRPVLRQQSVVPLGRISRWLIQAVIAAEDQKFFGHQGVDWAALQESVEKNLEKRRFARGGSTITQQLAKNVFFGTRKSLTRKARELVVTAWMENDLSKRRILELYLNVIEWGDGVYGAEAAARRYYGKPASDLDASEAAGLAAMIPNPRRINPQVAAARHARATKRVLWLMANAGFLEGTAAGLGSEPPPLEEVPEEGDDPPLPDEPPPPASPSPSPEPTPLVPIPDPATLPPSPEASDSR
jgi:monofunctional biosynthetic peptidoglycan transglycosylase